MSPRTWLLPAVLLFVVLWSCGSARAEPLIGAPDTVGYAFFIIPKSDPTDQEIAELRANAVLRLPGFKVVQSIADGSPAATLVIERLRPGSDLYYVPDETSLSFFARGLSAEDIRAIDGKHDIIALFFGYETRDLLKTHRQTLSFVAEAAEALSAFIYDDTTRETFTLARWREQRIDTWQGDLPEITRHYTIHSYPNGDEHRAVSLGLSKFGLPEIALNGFKPGDSDSAAYTINIISALLLQGRRPEADGTLSIAIEDIEHASLRDRLRALTFDNAARRATIRLESVAREEGDVNAELVGIAFVGAADERYRAQAKIYDALFGWKDELIRVSHEAQLLEASERAKKRLMSMKPTIAELLGGGHTLLVKGPFPTDSGGTEWMWIAVTGWKDKTITGVLTNKPYNIKTLEEGAIVSFSESDAFDYLLRKIDGTEDGNETSAIIEKMQRSGAQ